MKKLNLLYVIPMLFILTSCNLDFAPTDGMTPEQLAKDPSGAAYMTDGNYSLFKDEFATSWTYQSGNSYIRHYSMMSEYPSDNICLSGRTTDPLYEATCYKTNSTLANVTTLWWLGYKIIYGANSVIESVKDGTDKQSDYIKGENYFLRAICHLHLVTMYAKPYTSGRSNPGIVLRNSTDNSKTERATVGEVYDQIVADLKEAIRLMGNGGTRRGNAGYASKAAAQGLLSRVYLYMEENQKVIDLVNEMLDGADPSTKLEPSATFPKYFANALTSKETLWAVAHTDLETRGQASIGSMYLNDGTGWGETYSSDPLNNLYERYPNDLRYSYVVPVYKTNATNYMITFPVTSEGVDFRSNEIHDVTADANGKYYFTNNSAKVYVENETVNGYKQNYINFNGNKYSVRLTKKMADRNTFPKYYITKFSYQNNNPMLSSPVMLRWAEVILNRAEAYAKLNQNDKALNDVNVIRTRAGLSGDALFSATNMHGYTSVLDVVLDERRLELAFEGHRMIDVYRNKRSMNRQYAGVQPWEIINYDNNKIQYPIPSNEILVSGIEQNK
ncbi:MAG TPA: RagB/SusD family nutrient uptake outer membrane protein [Paludibacteraceae bacterium]|nr:RagB/SusD family nutrient uptake outer membrane protein [Paludibacteraceae bacterium]